MKGKVVIILSVLVMLALAFIITPACVWQPINTPNDGEDGRDGKSAFEIWLYAGHEGTYEDFLEWLRRPLAAPQTFTLSFS